MPSSTPSPGSEAAIKLSGMRELQRAVSRADRTIKRDLRDRLKKVAEPVAEDAETLALREIDNIGKKWSKMRVGVTRNLVYVAPKQRGVRTNARKPYKRPNLKELLLERSFDPALEDNRDNIERAVDRFIGEVADDWGRR